MMKTKNMYMFAAFVIVAILVCIFSPLPITFLFIVGPLAAVFWVYFRPAFPSSKLSRLEKGDVMAVKIARQKTAIPIGVFMEPETGWMVQAIAPQLNGPKLEFLKLSAPLHEVKNNHHSPQQPTSIQK